MLPEIELLLCCARTRLDPDKAARIKVLLREDIDWERLTHRALQHGVLPLLYRHLEATCAEAVPRGPLDQLRSLFESNLQRNLFLTGELYRILDLLETHQIAAIPYKGPALAASVYGNLALRQFSDLDILVRKQDVLRTGELLVSLGYRPQFQLNGAEASAFLQSQCELLFSRNDGRIITELHWEIVPRLLVSPLAVERLWERLDWTAKDGCGLATLPPEETLLILCVHGAKHLWERLGWICDIAELVRVHEGLDWKWVTEQAHTLGSERMLRLGLFLASDLLGAALPEEAIGPVGPDPTVKRLAEQVRERLLRGPDGQPGLLESCRFHLMAQERLQDRIQYCVRLAMTTTPGDWAFLPLPAVLFPLYYLVRPIRLAAKYSLGKLSAIRKEAFGRQLGTES